MRGSYAHYINTCTTTMVVLVKVNELMVLHGECNDSVCSDV